MINNSINTFAAESYSEFVDIIANIDNYIKKKFDLPKFSPLWFRGHKYSRYNLLPSLFRGQKKFMNIKDNYSKEHLLEDYKYQLFKSRAYDHVNFNTDSRIEWQEVMQHHFTKTRLMDWSEKITSPLIFALEPFLNPKNDLNCNYDRENITPSIWVVSPYELNRKVYETLTTKEGELCGDRRKKSYYYIRRALSDIISVNKLDSVSKKIGDELVKNKNIYFSEANGDSKVKNTISGIVGLSVIESYRSRNSTRLAKMLENFEFNPFFYLLSRYYIDGIPAPLAYQHQLPPLATIHPYHSNRIKAQAGAFSVYPYYAIDDNILDEKEMDLNFYKDIDIRCMDHQKQLIPILAKIDLVNPSKIASDLIISGNRRSNVYPELQTYSDDIEAMDYYV